MGAATHHGGFQCPVIAGHAGVGGHVVVQAAGARAHLGHLVHAHQLRRLPARLQRHVGGVAVDKSGAQAVPDLLHGHGIGRAFGLAVAGVLGHQTGFEGGLDAGADFVQGVGTLRAHIHQQGAARRHGAARCRCFAAGLAHGVSGFERVLALLGWRFHLGNLGDGGGHGLRSARPLGRGLGGGFELHLEPVAAGKVDGAATFRAKVGHDVERVRARALVLVKTVDLLHAGEVALALFTRGATQPHVVHGLDAVLFEHVRNGEHGRRIAHRIGVAGHIHAHGIACLGRVFARKGLEGARVVGVFHNAAVGVKSQGGVDGGQLGRGFDDRFAHGLQTDRQVGVARRWQHLGVDHVDVRFDQHLGVLALVRLRALAAAIAAFDGDTGVVDRQAIDNLHVRAWQMAIGTGLHIAGGKTPVADKTSVHFGRHAMFVARWRGNAHQLHVLVKARLFAGGRVQLGHDGEQFFVGHQLLRGSGNRRVNGGHAVGDGGGLGDRGRGAAATAHRRAAAHGQQQGCRHSDRQRGSRERREACHLGQVLPEMCLRTGMVDNSVDSRVSARLLDF